MRAWRALQVALGIGYEQDTATLTLSAVSTIELPTRGATLQFIADGGPLGTFIAHEVSGSTREGTIVIECAAVEPESQIRKPRDRSWRGGPLESFVRTIAEDAGLTAVVNPTIGGIILAARPQIAVSDLTFLQRLVEQHHGRLLIQEGRLLVSLVDQPLTQPPAFRVNLLDAAVWVTWRRSWNDTQQRIQAAYLAEDGATLETVEVGTGAPARRLPLTYATRDDALAAADAQLTYSETSRDHVEITTSLAPTARVLQPLDLVGADQRIPVGFPPLVIHQIEHTLGESVAETTITGRPATASTTS